MKRRYLFFITGMPMGGAERVMSTLANQFTQNGDEVRILTMKAPKCAYELDPRVEIVGAYAKMELSSLKCAVKSFASIVKGMTVYKKQLKEYKPDLVLAFLTYTNMTATIVGRKYAPVVISERCDPRERSEVLIKLVNHIYPKADCIVCQSKTIEKYFKEANPASETAVIPNPVNKNSINIEPIYNRKKKIIAAGRLSPQKNYELLIRAFNRICNCFPEYRVEIYGEGPEKDSLEKLIQELGLQSKIILMGTKLNVIKEEAAASLYVMSSDYEGFPNALAEAMASGLPVISTDFPSGVAHEIIEDGKNGYVVPLGDEEKLAEAMKKILSNSELQEIMSKNNEGIREQLSEAQVYKVWKELFEKLISER